MLRRQRYLQAALELFAAHGFVGTTTDMIVAQVGGSKATLYKYFPSKDDLIAGLMDRVVETMANRSAPEGLDEAPLADALTTLGTSLLRAVVSPGAVTLLRLCLGEFGRFPQLAQIVWEHGPAVTYADFARFLDTRRSRGELAVDDLQLASEHFLAAIAGHIQLKVAMGMREPPDEAEIAQRVAAAVATFLARYQTAPPSRR
ncbi:MAG: TetR/AcrR family transcriptional regulator [Myxococcota bacterium]